VRPADAEPYFRLGNLLYQMFFNCDQPLSQSAICAEVYATPRRRQSIIDAWDAFEQRAPLDPRVSEILVERAILNTKAVNGLPTDRRHLEAAARDYQSALDRNDGLTGVRGDEQLLGNLAETYMMLDRLDDSIASYVRAISAGAARTSTIYGLAVALDRDGSGEQAMRRIQAQGLSGFEQFTNEYMRHSVFFVPAGESDYYFALINEALGRYAIALELWNSFIASGAHPEFQPRAREHIAELRKKHVRVDPRPEPDDPHW